MIKRVDMAFYVEVNKPTSTQKIVCIIANGIQIEGQIASFNSIDDNIESITLLKKGSAKPVTISAEQITAIEVV